MRRSRGCSKIDQARRDAAAEGAGEMAVKRLARTTEPPVGTEGAALRSMSQVTRLQLSLADNLDTLCRVVWYVADEDVSEDELIGCLAILAHDESEVVPPGRERAWLLRTLLKLLGACVLAESEQAGDLPKLLRPSTPVDAAIPDGAFLRLHEALRAIDKPERASVVLVVQEGLSVAEGVRIQGGSRSEFQRRVDDGMAALDDDLIEALMGRVGRSPRS
jgi:DNA-directed RNA polymerase specialized sigma24 family protein